MTKTKTGVDNIRTLKVLTSTRTVSKGGSFNKYILALKAMLDCGWEIHCIVDSIEEMPLRHNSLKLYEAAPYQKKINTFSFLMHVMNISKTILIKNNINVLFAYHPFIMAPMMHAVKTVPKYTSKNCKKKRYQQIISCLSVRGNFEYETKIKRGKLISKIFSYLEAKVLKKTDVIITVNHDLKNKLVDKYGVNKNRIKVLYNSINNAFRPSDQLRTFFRRRNSLNPDLFVIGFIGDFGHVKGSMNLLNAFSNIHSNNPHLVLFIAGGDNHFSKNYQNMTRFITKKKIKNSVTFLGRVANTSELINGVDLVVVPSYYEGCPSVVLEAMGCERLVIGTDVGGIKEILLDEKFLFKENTPQHIAAKIVEIYKNKNLQRELKNTLLKRKKYFQFDWEKKFTNIILKATDKR